MEFSIETFFNRSEEEKLNSSLISGNVLIDESIRYVSCMCEEPLSAFWDYIMGNCSSSPIESADIYQFSSFDDATWRFCQILKEYPIKGYCMREIGEMLQNDGKIRTQQAKNKYGENHAKMATELGFAYAVGNKHNMRFYLSSVGMVILSLPEDVRKKYVTRCIMRSKLITRLLLESRKSNVVYVENVLYDIAEATYYRRRSNVKRVINELENSNEYDFSQFVACLRF